MAGKRRTHCFKGHELTPENTYQRPATGQRYCKTCKKATQNTTVAKIKIAEGIKNWHLRIRYGLTPQQYEKMLKDADGRCSLCKRPCEKLFVDHDHTTKKVREMLCRACNSGLGMFGDDIELMQRAIEYVKRHSNA
jgi:hypothetical protein